MIVGFSFDVPPPFEIGVIRRSWNDHWEVGVTTPRADGLNSWGSARDRDPEWALHLAIENLLETIRNYR